MSDVRTELKILNSIQYLNLGDVLLLEFEIISKLFRYESTSTRFTLSLLTD